MTRNVSGLDMGPTIEWYEREKPISESAMSSSAICLGFPYIIKGQEHIHLDPKKDMNLPLLYYTFPENARKRSVITQVTGKPSLWFHRDSIPEAPIPTNDVTEAISPTAIIPSYANMGTWLQTGVPSIEIELYEIPENIASPYAREVIHAEGFVHELAHTIVNPAVFLADEKLKIPGRVVNAQDYVLGEFVEMAERHLPVSHYAAFYRNGDGTFVEDPRFGTRVAVSEELCETIAAYLLGFAYCGDDERGKRPFEDRPEIQLFVDSFLNAEQVSK